MFFFQVYLSLHLLNSTTFSLVILASFCFRQPLLAGIHVHQCIVALSNMIHSQSDKVLNLPIHSCLLCPGFILTRVGTLKNSLRMVLWPSYIFLLQPSRSLHLHSRVVAAGSIVHVTPRHDQSPEGGRWEKVRDCEALAIVIETEALLKT